METKKILGLDLGVGSIGWALIETSNDIPQDILAMGSRIVPLSHDDSVQFPKGQAITRNADRTARRTARKGYDRYQLRRSLLTQILRNNSMLPESMSMNVFDLWKLRADAATNGNQLSLMQIGRVLYHINQKRGYKHAKSDVSADSKQTKYVAAVNERWSELQSLGLTIGQYFYGKLQEGRVGDANANYSTFRIKDKVYPRAAYIAEFDKIMQVQKQFYPKVLTDELIDLLRNRIIFYQRPLKSCKHLVSLCEFEMKPYKTNDGKVVYGGPKVAPRTSPLAQLCKIWEMVNNLTLTNRNGEHYNFTLEERRKLVDFLDYHEKLTLTDMYKLLGITKKDGWWGGKAIGKGLEGNTTKMQLLKALGNNPDKDKLLQLKLEFVDSELVDTETGEILQMVSPDIENEPLYKLWHVVYSISDKEQLAVTLKKNFGITDSDVVENLFNIDFVKPGYANKSTRFMRRLIPYLQQGLMYSEACAYIGINHSRSLNKKENAERPLLTRLPQLQKNELRQPVIEKILNQMVNVVNALTDKYGSIDEIRVELARELKQSKEEREETDKSMRKNERLNKDIAEKIKEYGVRPSRIRIQKYKMWEESLHKCMYCGKSINVSEFLQGSDSEVEHIIPRSVLFDDSFSNKVCSCRECNRQKGNLTAYDFMQTRGEAELGAYTERVKSLFDQKLISKTKRDHLLWKAADIPQDFIDRQLRQSQYIAKKAVEMLQQICREVHATSGSVTDFLRHEWGYDEVLHNLNFERYKQAGLTDIVTYENNGVSQTKERIHNWTKRIDHRHHAVDALTIALTRQAYIQRLNTLNASREKMFDELHQLVHNAVYEEKKSLLQKWVAVQPHFDYKTVLEKVDGILVSFRAGKRVTTPAKRAIYSGGKRIVVQRGLLVPRGAMSEESVYGKVKGEYVIKYPLNSLKLKDTAFIIDPQVRELVVERLKEFNDNPNNAFAEPLYSDKNKTMLIRSVRCFTGLKEKAVAPVKFNQQGEPIGFVKPGNNHHIAIYRDKDGNYQESVVSFWNAVERKRYGLPVVIENPHNVWTKVMDMELPESLLKTLPNDDWEFVLSMQQNEMFIMGMEEDAYQNAIERRDYNTLNKYLYRVQKIQHRVYYFRSHIETSVDDKYDGERNEIRSKLMKKVIVISSLDMLKNQNPHKVKINILGEISEQ